MTILSYLKDTYHFSATAKLTEVNSEPDRTYLCLDQTIFYPQGGGQAADIGLITGESFEFRVADVRLTETGIVRHYGQLLSGNPEVGQTAGLQIDREQRLQNAQNHTAGHLIDLAVAQLDFPLEAEKGFHFATGPYVQFAGVLPDCEENTEILQKQIDALVTNNLELVVDEQPSQTIAPAGKTPRFVYFAGYKSQGCGCGGTHVRATAEIGEIFIRKIKLKKGKTKISYQVS